MMCCKKLLSDVFDIVTGETSRTLVKCADALLKGVIIIEQKKTKASAAIFIFRTSAFTFK